MEDLQMSSASLNEVRLIGNLGRDPESKPGPNGTFKVSISLATAYHGREGDPITTWHRVVFWGAVGERALRLMRKGASVFIGGRLDTRRYTDGDGTERWITEVVGEHFQMLGSRTADAAPQDDGGGAAGAEGGTQGQGPEDDDIPF
jgi:single-strand DNA-binding protein